MSAASPSISRRDLEALAGEIIGASVSIQQHPGIADLPVEGTIVDETMHLVIVRESKHGRVRRIPKSGLVGSILLGGRELPLKGEFLRVRPEDRTKRLLAGGSKRLA